MSSDQQKRNNNQLQQIDHSEHSKGIGIEETEHSQNIFSFRNRTQRSDSEQDSNQDSTQKQSAQSNQQVINNQQITAQQNQSKRQQRCEEKKQQQQQQQKQDNSSKVHLVKENQKQQIKQNIQGTNQVLQNKDTTQNVQQNQQRQIKQVQTYQDETKQTIPIGDQKKQTENQTKSQNDNKIESDRFQNQDQKKNQQPLDTKDIHHILQNKTQEIEKVQQSTKDIKTETNQTKNSKMQDNKKKQSFIDEQMQADLQMIKKQYKKPKKNKDSALVPKIGEQKQKNKQREKQRLNKTTVNTRIFKQESDGQQFHRQQAIMLNKMAIQKKKQNFQRLRKWDKRRQESLALNRNSIEILQNEVDKRIKASMENLQVYSTFFRQKARQQQKYASYPIINTRYALQHNSLSKNIYINCSVILNSLSDQNNARCRKITDFMLLIQNDILQNLIVEHQNQSQRQLLRVREKISALKNSLRKYNSETEQKSNQLSIFFNQKAINTNAVHDKDFYAAQLQFLRKASQQTMVQKKLSEYCIEYYETAIQEEVKRSKVIREAIVTFTKGLKECYNYQSDPAEIQQLCKDQEYKLIEQFYTLEEIFDERSLQVFRSHLGLSQQEQLAIEHYKKYINKFQFEHFDCRIALLKEFNLKYLSTNKNEPKIEENCYMVITADCFLHIFLSKQKTDTYAKPDISLRLGTKHLDFKPDKSPSILDIVVKDEKRHSMISYFWDNKNDKIHRLKFPKQDTREQFLDFIHNKAF